MVKKDFIKKISEKLKKSSAETEEIYEIFFGTIKEAMKNGEQLVIKEFGKFEVVERAGRIGRNPQTGESIMIKPKKIVRFKASSHILENNC